MLPHWDGVQSYMHPLKPLFKILNFFALTKKCPNFTKNFSTFNLENFHRMKLVGHSPT